MTRRNALDARDIDTRETGCAIVCRRYYERAGTNRIDDSSVDRFDPNLGARR
jgi:hypothetical protein